MSDNRIYYFLLLIRSSISREKGVDEEVTLANDIQVLYYLEGVYHDGAGGTIKHSLLLCEYIVLHADPISSEK